MRALDPQQLIHLAACHLDQVHSGKRMIALAAQQAVGAFIGRCSGAAKQFVCVVDQLFEGLNIVMSAR